MPVTADNDNDSDHYEEGTFGSLLSPSSSLDSLV